MASLIDRIQGGASSSSSTGPTRNKSNSRRASPYARSDSKSDVNSAWNHDKFEEFNSLQARLNLSGGSKGSPTAGTSSSTVKMAPNGIFNRALGGAIGAGGSSGSAAGFSIKGASVPADANTVQVSGLLGGTTAADVEAIFKQCGAIIKSQVKSSSADNVTIRLVFKTSSGAKAAVEKFHNMKADGRTLSVTLVGQQSTSLAGRFVGQDIIKLQGDSVDVLMDSARPSASKMRSDELISTPGSIVQIAPPGADPREYTQRQNRGRGGGGGGQRGRGSRRGGGGRG